MVPNATFESEEEDIPIRQKTLPRESVGSNSPKKESKPAQMEPAKDLPELDSSNGQTNGQTNGEEATTLLEEDPFSSEASKILFDGMDRLRGCGAAVDLELPQLVIVGSQSAGKSSLLRSLTDIPFPVGSKLCTRFATRIISRRSAPDAPDVVKISIEKGVSEPFEGQIRNQKEPFNHHMQSITPEAFDDIFRKANEYMGLTGQRVSRKNNYSSDILRIELHGPSRSHFGILDVPGIFQTATGSVTKEEKARVESMVTSHMKKPESVIICVAPADGDLANQGIFELAKEHAESSRVVGVFTKCDRVPNPKDIVQIVRDNKEIALHNGWFVVQNLPEGASPTLNCDEEEKLTFSTGAWLEIPTRQRGTMELKRFLANILSSRISKAFPEVQRRLRDLLAIENEYMRSLGHERLEPEQRWDYLHGIVGRYQELARETLSGPERLPSDAMKLRGLTRKAMQDFAEMMKQEGHFYNFADVKDVIDKAQPDATPLYVEIRRQIDMNRGEELTGMTNPAVLKALFIKQSSKWESIGQKYLDNVVKMSKDVALLILDYISSECGVPNHTKAELQTTIDGFETKAREIATFKLHEFCAKNSTFLLVTTDDNFETKVKEAQHARFTAALRRYVLQNPSGSFFPKPFLQSQTPETLPKLQSLIEDWVIIDSSHVDKLFEHIHPRATRNTDDEIHDLLKAYYEIAREAFKTHTIRIVEEFLHEPQGPLFGLSMKYILSLSNEQVQILGGEDESVVLARSGAKKRIADLEEGVRIAGETWRKSLQTGV